MKKILILFILFFILSAQKCKEPNSIQQTSYVFEHSYSSLENDKSINELYRLTNLYKLDSIPLDKWLSLKNNVTDGYILQYFATKYTDSCNYVFVYNFYYKEDTSFYTIKVRKIIDKK